MIKKFLSKYSDQDHLSEWVMRGTALSIKEGITQGTDNHQLSAKANADRAQVSSLLSCMLKRMYFLN